MNKKEYYKNYCLKNLDKIKEYRKKYYQLKKNNLLTKKKNLKFYFSENFNITDCRLKDYGVLKNYCIINKLIFNEFKTVHNLKLLLQYYDSLFRSNKSLIIIFEDY